jgi:hypothetical protein
MTIINQSNASIHAYKQELCVSGIISNMNTPKCTPIKVAPNAPKRCFKRKLGKEESFVEELLEKLEALAVGSGGEKLWTDTPHRKMKAVIRKKLF